METELDFTALPEDEIVCPDSRCPTCGEEMQRGTVTVGGYTREVLNCPSHGVVAAYQNRSLVRRLLEQMGNPGDAIFAAAGRRNPSPWASAKPPDPELVRLIRDVNAGKPESRVRDDQ
jgi:hypothetical protein